MGGGNGRSIRAGARRAACRRAGAVVGALIGAACLAVPAASATAGAAVPRTGGYGFDQPDAIALVGPDLFVTNKAGNSVTKLLASTGAHVATYAAAGLHLDGPTAIAAVGGELFVADGKGNSLTEMTPAGALVRLVPGSTHGFADPIGLATDGAHVFVLGAGGSVVKITASTGAADGRASGRSYEFDRATAIAYGSGHLFVTNSNGNTVTEIDAATMRLVKVLSAPSYHFSKPVGATAHATSHGTDVFVSNQAGQTVTELLAGSAALVQVVPDSWGYLPSPGAVTYGDGYLFVASPPGGSPMITQVVATAKPPSLPWMMCDTNGPYDFTNPAAMIVVGTHLWVVNETGNGGQSQYGSSLTEMNASSGALIKVVR